jgi:hypothetical protein
LVPFSMSEHVSFIDSSSLSSFFFPFYLWNHFLCIWWFRFLRRMESDQSIGWPTFF